MDAQRQKLQQDADEAPAPIRARKVNLPLRLSPEQHDALRKVAFERRVSIHALMLEGVAEVLRRYGR